MLNGESGSEKAYGLLFRYNKLESMQLRNSFLKNIVVLLSGSVFAQALGFLAIPVLTRLYTPADFGIAATYAALTNMLVIVISARYEYAITLPKDDKDAVNILILSLIIMFGGCLLSLVIIMNFRNSIANAFGNNDLAEYLLLLPLSLFLAGGYQAFSYWATRNDFFKQLSISRASQTIGSIGWQVGWAGIISPGALGLISGQVIGQFFALFILIRKILKVDLNFIIENIDRKQILLMLNEYRKIPFFVLPAHFLNGLSTQTLPLLVIFYFGASAAGIVFVTQRVLTAPVKLIVSSVWQVNYSKIGVMSNHQRKDLIFNTHRLSAYGYALPLVMAFFLAEYADVIFGEEWSEIKSIIPAIVAMIYFNSVSNSISYFTAYGYFKMELVTNILLASVRVIALVIGGLFFSLSETVIFYSIVSILVYLGINTFWAMKLQAFWNFGLNYMFGVLLSFGILYSTMFISYINVYVSIGFFIMVSILYYVLLLKHYGYRKKSV